MSTPIIGMTQGDPHGIGPEVIQKALHELKRAGAYRLVVVGDKKHFENLPAEVALISPDVPDETGLTSLEIATKLCLQNEFSALVTAPLSKHKVSDYLGKAFTGHTEYLARACHKHFKKPFHPTMLFIGEREKLALVTTHLPLKDVAHALTEKLIKKTVQNVTDGLRNYFNINSPSIALLGLNPHAGEGGLLGTEERTYFRNILSWAKDQNIHLSGPFPADSFFSSRWADYDVTIAMYHDQGLAPFKARNYRKSVNVTLGLPILRTSVDHGVGYDIAHTGKADASSMIEAITCAATLAKNHGRR